MINVHVDFGDIVNKSEQAVEYAQKALDQQVLKDSNEFIPFNTGHLRDSSIQESKIGQGLIVWDMPYAKRLFYNPQYNFSKDSNPNAGGRWFDRAKAVHGNEWPDVAKKAVNKYIGEH